MKQLSFKSTNVFTMHGFHSTRGTTEEIVYRQTYLRCDLYSQIFFNFTLQ